MIKVLRAYFDLSIIAHAVGGVSRYLLSAAAAVSEISPQFGIDFQALDVPAVHPGVPGPDYDCISLRTPAYLKIPFIRRYPLKKNLEEKSRSSRLSAVTGANAVFHHSGVQPCCPPECRSVITIYDLSALEHPEWHTEQTVMYAEREAELIRNGSFVLAISSWTGQRVREYFDLPEDRIFCAGGAADEIFSPGFPSADVLSEFGLEPGGYLLHVGNFVPRKNIPFLLDTYARSRMEGVRLPLVLAGTGEWGDITVTEGDGIRVLKSVSDSSMVELYRGARALLCPSRFEGLGLPVLEAFACGTPVISSNAAALSDTVGENGITIDPEDTEAWIREITELEKPERVNELRNMSSAAVRQNWSDIGKGICAFYRRISGL